MGKVYQFPQKKQLNPTHIPMHSESKVIMENAVQVLMDTYMERINQLNNYITAIRNLDRSDVKNPKELLEVVTKLDGIFTNYGIINNFYTFSTLSNKFVNYYNDNKTLGVFEQGKEDEIEYYSMGEFIREFEYHKFTFMMHEEIYKILEKQINDLKITIEVLEKTSI